MRRHILRSRGIPPGRYVAIVSKNTVKVNHSVVIRRVTRFRGSGSSALQHFSTSALLQSGRVVFPAIRGGELPAIRGGEFPAIRGGELPAHSLFKKTLLRNCTAHSAGFVFRAVHFSTLPHFSEVFYHTICDLKAIDYETINSSQKITDKKASLLQTSHLSVPPGNRFLFSGRYKLQKQSFDTGSNCREG